MTEMVTYRIHIPRSAFRAARLAKSGVDSIWSIDGCIVDPIETAVAATVGIPMLGDDYTGTFIPLTPLEMSGIIMPRSVKRIYDRGWKSHDAPIRFRLRVPRR